MQVEQTREWKLATLADMRARAKRERRASIIQTTAATVGVCVAALTAAIFVFMMWAQDARWYADDERWNMTALELERTIIEQQEHIITQLAVQKKQLETLEAVMLMKDKKNDET